MTWPLFVLSLPGCEARRAPLLAALDSLGLAAEVLLGVDGRQGLPPAHEREVDRRGTLRAMGLGNKRLPRRDRGRRGP